MQNYSEEMMIKFIGCERNREDKCGGSKVHS